ncbi:MAG: sodium:solute symporter [Saprospiraceae bacterium]|nr:sodium:solute symporter [Saprospiraceae bacterium]
MESGLSPLLLITIIGVYFLGLIFIGHLTGKQIDNKKFFLAGKNSPWWLVAIGMVGSSLSGVTFMSIPGVVGSGGANMAFSYLQLVFGYLAGYLVIIYVLLPLYYKTNLTSIYGYLGERFDLKAQKTGSAFFILSRMIQSAFRLFLVAIVIQQFITGPLGWPFWCTAMLTLILIYVYTFKGGINTIIWTDPLQTFFMLFAVIFTIIAISSAMDTSVVGLFGKVYESDYSRVFFFEGGWTDPNNFFKQFLSGALITIVMTGLDQDMMQKNLSCKTLKESQKNMITYSIVIAFVNVLFLSLGAMLYFYAADIGVAIPARTDELFPMLAMEHLPVIVGVVFILGLIAAAYSSADSALTALTTSFCIDFLGFGDEVEKEAYYKTTRRIIHVVFALIMGIVIVLFEQLNDDAVISKLFEAAGYTYGPLLGLFAFGIMTKLHVKSLPLIVVCIVSPILSYFMNLYSEDWFGGFKFGFTIIALNGALTFLGLFIFSYRRA